MAEKENTLMRRLILLFAILALAPSLALAQRTGPGSLPSGLTGVQVLDRSGGFLYRSVFAFASKGITITDATTNGAHGGLQIYDWPAGQIRVLGATSDLAIVAGAGGITDTAAVICSIGEVVVANTDATLTSTEANIMPSTAASLTAGAGNCDGEMTITQDAVLDGTATAKDIYLNFAVPDAGSTANDTLEVTGTLTVVWMHAGDN